MINKIQDAKNKWRTCKYKLVARYFFDYDSWYTFILPIQEDTTEYFSDKEQLIEYMKKRERGLYKIELLKRIWITPFFKPYFVVYER